LPISIANGRYIRASLPWGVALSSINDRALLDDKSMPQPVIFLMANFSHFAKYILKNLYILSQIPFELLYFGQICHNCLQYERVLKIFYFHILKIAKID
jgi:hypothetical protein